MYDWSTKIITAVNDWLHAVMPEWAAVLTGWVLVAVIFIALLALLGLGLVLGERKVAAFFQLRLGPNRVGPWGLFQTVADTIKLLLKEPVGTRSADKFIYNLAPFLIIIGALMGMSVLPFSKGLQAFDIDIGIFFVLAVSSIGVLGILLGGWSSNNKYALLGAMRSGAQMISYELSVGLSLITMVLLTGSLQMSEIIESQRDYWLIFKGHVPAFIAFVIFIIAGTAETNRTPFDLTEAESELGAGFHTEYSGIKFAFFFLSEFVNMFIIAALASIVFLGGWMPLHLGGWEGFNQVMDFIPPVIWFFGKVSFIIFLIMWFRWTFPRLRVDQLLTLEWKYLLPLNLMNILLMALIVLLGWHL